MFDARSSLGLLTLSLLLTSGCSDNVDGTTPVDEPTETTWGELVVGEWSLEGGTEGYVCSRTTITEDIFVGGFRAIAPPGTHHTVLTVSTEPDGPDAVFPCNAGTVGLNMIYGSGVGTNEFTFPEGVAVRLPAGSQVLLNLHLFNTATNPIDGISGIEVARLDPADVVHEAEIVLAGKTGGLRVEPGVTTQTGRCEMSHDVTIFSVFPHMHQMGTRLKATAMPAGGASTVLVDEPYEFEDQLYYPVSPMLELAAGDEVMIDCTYDNRTRETVTFGDSSLEEMCFAGLYRYPKRDGGFFICDSDVSGGGPSLEGPPCAEEADVGNELGVGRFCTEDGDECTGEAGICLADFVSGDFGNFCTTQCGVDADCGDGAICFGSTGRRVCVPASCELPN